MGRNGAGKSTLLRLAAGLTQPTRGRIERGRPRLAAAAEPRRLPGRRARGGRAVRRSARGRRPRLARRPPPARPLRRRAPAARARASCCRASRPPSSASTSRPAAWTAATRTRWPPACASWRRQGTAVLVATHDAEFAAPWAERTVLLGDGAPGRRRADRRGARRRLVLRDPDRPHPRRLRAAARGRRGAAARGACGHPRVPGRGRGRAMSWVAASLLVLGLALAAGFAWYERTHPTSRVLALVATLAALAALGRIAFAPLPNVKPTTDIVLLTGYVARRRARVRGRGGRGARQQRVLRPGAVDAVADVRVGRRRGRRRAARARRRARARPRPRSRSPAGSPARASAR